MAATASSVDSPDPAATPVTRARRRWARGPARPQYLQAADVDHLLHIVVALMSEVSALRDRIDTHELLAAAGLPATAAPSRRTRSAPTSAPRANNAARRCSSAPCGC